MKCNAFFSILASLVLFVACNNGMAQRPAASINFPDGEQNSLTAAEKSAGWKLLFNGDNLDGWHVDEKHKGNWYVENGIIVSDQQGASHLFTDGKYKNFEATWDVCAYDVRIPKQRLGNSGVFVRTVKRDSSFPLGYEIQVDHYDVNNPTGGIYNAGFNGDVRGTLLVDKDGNWKPEAFFEVHEGKWFNQRVKVEGDRIQIWINGKQTLDWTDPESKFPEAGPLALQNHHGSDVVLFSNIKIKEIK